MPPILYVVSTPIGNRADLSFRALETLKSVDYILCEDTRHSRKLLTLYEIDKPLKSCHGFNERWRTHRVIADLTAGQDVALISDAGTPGISDPGMRLISACRKEGLAMTAIPGPCALIDALVLSGFDTSRFQFVGFLPRRAGALKRMLEEMLSYPGTSVAYESPKRIHKVLKLCPPDCRLGIAREMTKKFEEVLVGSPTELLESEYKGEIVLLMEGPWKSSKS